MLWGVGGRKGVLEGGRGVGGIMGNWVQMGCIGGKGVKRGFVGIMGCLRHKSGVWGRKGVFWGVIVSFLKVFMKRNFRL